MDILDTMILSLGMCWYLCTGIGRIMADGENRLRL